MLGTYFYHEIIRKTIISFGTLFNDISIRHTKSDGSILDETKVGLSYGPMQKFLTKIQEQDQLTKPIAITLPRMSFEMTTIQYDSTRKTGVTQTFKANDTTDNKTKKVFMPVPYNIGFELNIFSKLNDDALQIVEQILPYFQPSYNLSIELVSELKEKRDVPIVLENISMQDDYEGDYSSRRVLLYTLRFTAKTYLFGPTTSATKDIIKKVTIPYYAGESGAKNVRDVTYQTVPRALKDYNSNVVTTLSKDVTLSDKIIEVADASSIPKSTRLDIDGEQLYVTSKSGNKLFVRRGEDATTIASHLLGGDVKTITVEDNVFIDEGDNFGFDGSFL